MAPTTEDLMPASAEPPSTSQRTFLRYLTGMLIDLVVLNLFAEYTDRVFLDSFTISLLAATLLQVLLRATIWVEHRVAQFFKARPGGWNKFLRFFFAWLVLFGSKFVILEAMSSAFGESVRFVGAYHGLVVLILVIVVMLVAEELVVRFYRKLA